MKILDVSTLKIPSIKVIRFGRFLDQRGYFSEIFRNDDFQNHPDLSFLKDITFTQSNESYSLTNTIRGLHVQWNPCMAKLVRTIQGHMIDVVLDIRKNSPTFGQILTYDMPCDPGREYSEWIWIPPGFAHGNFFLENTTIEYFCTGHYNPDGEASISPLDECLDWGYVTKEHKEQFDRILKNKPLITDKDKNGLTLQDWKNHPGSDHFTNLAQD